MSQQLIIAGFHRSGTSATAQLLHRAGLFLGHELLEALPSNPYGHFEDREVVNLHQQILIDNDRTWLVDEPLLPVVSTSCWQKMRQMIEHRNTEHRLWGFKDPRVCIFMMLWKYLLPDAKVLLVYRHFSESTRSLGKRHSSDLFSGKGNSLIHRSFWREPDLALKMWLVHNEALLAFAKAYPEDTLVVSFDMVRDGFPLIWAIKKRWGFGLEEIPVAEAFDPGATGGRSGRQLISDQRLIPRAEKVWRSLEELGAETERMLAEYAPIEGARVVAG